MTLVSFPPESLKQRVSGTTEQKRAFDDINKFDQINRSHIQREKALVIQNRRMELKQAAVEILKAKTIDPFVRGRICTILEAQQDKPFVKKTLIDQLNALLNTSYFFLLLAEKNK